MPDLFTDEFPSLEPASIERLCQVDNDDELLSSLLERLRESQGYIVSQEASIVMTESVDEVPYYFEMKLSEEEGLSIKAYGVVNSGDNSQFWTFQGEGLNQRLMQDMLSGLSGFGVNFQGGVPFSIEQVFSLNPTVKSIRTCLLKNSVLFDKTKSLASTKLPFRLGRYKGENVLVLKNIGHEECYIASLDGTPPMIIGLEDLDEGDIFTTDHLRNVEEKPLLEKEKEALLLIGVIHSKDVFSAESQGILDVIVLKDSLKMSEFPVLMVSSSWINSRLYCLPCYLDGKLDVTRSVFYRVGLDGEVFFDKYAQKYDQDNDQDKTKKDQERNLRSYFAQNHLNTNTAFWLLDNLSVQRLLYKMATGVTI